MNSSSIYKSKEAKNAILKLYDEKLNAIQIEFQDIYVSTFAGKTHVIASGNQDKPPIVILHGINAGAPMALETVKNLRNDYRIYAIDTIGQTTKSAENRLSIKDASYGKWLAETLDNLNIEKAPIIGMSFGAVILQKMMLSNPDKIEKGIFVVPAGIVHGSFFKLLWELIIPLVIFLFIKSEKHLLRFMNSFYNESDKCAVEFQENILLGTKMDFRKLPLLQKKDVRHFQVSVYGIFADQDIFFPADESIKKCKHIFSNFKGYTILKNTKHIPGYKAYPLIERQIRKWLEEK